MLWKLQCVLKWKILLIVSVCIVIFFNLTLYLFKFPTSLAASFCFQLPPFLNKCKRPDSPCGLFSSALLTLFWTFSTQVQSRCLHWNCIALLKKNHNSVFFLFDFFFPHCMACGILVPPARIEPTPPALEVQSFNHWITKEVPQNHNSQHAVCSATCSLIPLSAYPSVFSATVFLKSELSSSKCVSISFNCSFLFLILFYFD